MKARNIIIASLATVLLFTACKDNEKNMSREEKTLKKNAGILRVDLNGKNWEHSVVLASYQRDDPGYLEFSASVYKGGVLDQVFSTSGIPLEEGTHKVFNIQHMNYGRVPNAIFSNTHDDVGLTYYTVVDDSGSHSFVTINHYDAGTNEVEGTLELKLFRNFGTQIPGFPDTLHFTNGWFRLKIRDME